MIRNESLIDEGRNRFKRAPRQTSACARRASTLGASPRASGRPLAWGGSAQSASPDRLTSGRARVGAAAVATPRSPRAARTARGTGWRAPTSREPKLRQVRAPRCICGCGSAVGGSARTARRSAGQGGGGGGPGGRAPTLVANAQGRAFRKHAGAGSVDVALPLLYAARRLWPGCCLGGGRLGQRPNAANAAWAVAGWGRGCMW
jgi:hypothetical protein